MFQVDKILLRPEEFYKKHHIEFKLETEVVELNPETKCVALRSGETIVYDRCLVATGGMYLSSCLLLSLSFSTIQITYSILVVHELFQLQE